MKYIRDIIAIVFISFLFFLFMAYIEMEALDGLVITPADVTLEHWLDNFKLWAEVGIVISLGTSLLWYGLGQWVFKLNDWKKSDRRVIWYLCFLLPAGAVILSIMFTHQAQEGAFFAYIFYTLNNLLCLYFATVLFSPSSYKYTPLGASKLRFLR